MRSAVGCSVGSDVYHTMLFEVGVKSFAGEKFSSATQRFRDTVKFAFCTQNTDTHATAIFELTILAIER
jgi:hypothetical protein